MRSHWNILYSCWLAFYALKFISYIYIVNVHTHTQCPLHMNVQGTNFQIWECAFTYPITQITSCVWHTLSWVCILYTWLFLYTLLHSTEYWSGLPFSFSGNLPNPGLGPSSPLLYLARGFFTTEAPGKPNVQCTILYFKPRYSEASIKAENLDVQKQG